MKIFTIATAVLLAAALGTTPAAANEPAAESAELTDMPDTTDTAAEADTLTDEQLEEEVRQALRAEPSFDGAEKIEVTARDGRVTLTGAVSADEEKDLAVTKAESIAGPGNVVDKINVND
jgi:osmotically-inducible protein OsmY